MTTNPGSSAMARSGQPVPSDLAEGEDILGQTLPLVAEAQSALRVAVQEVGGGTDSDQVTAFDWLRRKGDEERVSGPEVEADRAVLQLQPGVEPLAGLRR